MNGFEMTIEAKRAVVQLIGLHNRQGLKREKQIEYKKRIELMSDDEIEMIYERTKANIDRIDVRLTIDSIYLT